MNDPIEPIDHDGIITLTEADVKAAQDEWLKQHSRKKKENDEDRNH